MRVKAQTPAVTVVPAMHVSDGIVVTLICPRCKRFLSHTDPKPVVSGHGVIIGVEGFRCKKHGVVWPDFTNEE